MATPSYTTIVNSVITRLQEDTRLSAIPDGSIYFGLQPNIPTFPAITVELVEGIDEWRTYPTNKDIISRITITVMERSMQSYAAGLQAVEGYVQIIDDVLHTDPKVSGTFYNSEVVSRRLGPGTYNDIPIFVCEMEFQGMTRYSSRSVS